MILPKTISEAQRVKTPRLSLKKEVTENMMLLASANKALEELPGKDSFL